MDDGHFQRGRSPALKSQCLHLKHHCARDTEALLLLLHKHQGQLGVVLDTRDGVAWLKGHPHEWLRARRVAGPGLLAACTSDFANLRGGEGPMTFKKLYRGAEITSPFDLPGSPDSEGEKHCADMGGREFARKPIKVITFGLDSLEKGTQSHALARTSMVSNLRPLTSGGRCYP